MHFQSMWTRFFLLFALVLAVVAQPIDRSGSLVLRQDATNTNDVAGAAATSDAPVADDDPANDIDEDALFKRKGPKIGSSSKSPSPPASRPASPPPPPAAKPATPPPPPAAKPNTPPPPPPAKPATPPPKTAKKQQGKAKPPLPSAEISNSAKNRLKNADILFFSGTQDAAGTKKAKDFAAKNGMKTISDAFKKGDIDNINQFAGTKEEKTAYLKLASENFAKAIPANTQGKVFAMFPGNAPPAQGIFNTVEVPALKANGHTSMIKLDFNDIDNLDPKTATGVFNL